MTNTKSIVNRAKNDIKQRIDTIARSGHHLIELTLLYAMFLMTKPLMTPCYNAPMKWRIAAHLMLTADKIVTNILAFRVLTLQKSLMRSEQEARSQNIRFPHPMHFTSS